MYRFIAISMFIFLPFSVKILHAQQIDKLKNQSPVTIDGNIMTNQVMNNQIAGDSYDYTGYYAGTLDFNVYGVSIPLTFMYSSRKTNFSYPFNQFGLHPSYKWAKAHLGYASMSFSPYTLNGRLFLGTGIELAPPGMFRVSVMYGRLQKAVNFDTTKLPAQLAYERMGYAVKFGIVNENDYVELILFNAKDATFSNNFFMDSLGIKPKENTVSSIRVGKTLFENLKITAEIAGSSLSNDYRAMSSDNHSVWGNSNQLFMPFTINTITRKAIKSNLSYSFEGYGIGIGYERIDPDYVTLGAYYFTNNLENMTLNLNASFFENKLTFYANTGLQRDLDKNKMNSTNRFVGSINTSLAPNEKLNLNFSYSNFLSYTNIRSTFDYINQTDPYQNYDTLKYRQISQNMNFSGNYQLPDLGNTKHNFSANLNYQVSNNIAGDSTNTSQFYNISGAYVFSISAINLSITPSINLNYNDLVAAHTSAWGPGISVSKLFFERKLRSFLSYSYNTSKTGDFNNGNINNYRLGWSYNIKKQHSFSISGLLQHRTINVVNSTVHYRDIYAVTFGYMYNFSLLKGTKTANATNVSN